MIRWLCAIFLSSSFVFSFHKFPDWQQKTENMVLKKEGFLLTLLPIIEQENQKILKERAFVETFFEKEFLSKTKKDNILKLAKLAKKYKIQKLYDKDAFLKKIDLIPPSMALAQAALESDWGRSSYAKKLNNIYGHYFFNPKSSSKNAKRFNSLNEAVASYFLNINTNEAYAKFRELRAKIRVGDINEFKGFSGLEAVKTLDAYSEMKKEYVKLLSSLINSNEFYIFDKNFMIETNKSLVLDTY